MKKVNFKKVLSFLNKFKFKKKDVQENTIDYLKNKKAILIGFFILLVGFVSLFCIFLTSNEQYFDLENKTTISVPIKKELDQSELDEIKTIATHCMFEHCTVQQTTPDKEFNMGSIPKKIIISYNENFDKTSPEIQKKLDNLCQMLNYSFSNELDIKNKEEIILENFNKSQVNEISYYQMFIILLVVLLVLGLFFAINYRKLNGFLVCCGFFASLLFNIAITSCAFIGLTMFFNLNGDTSNEVLIFKIFIVVSIFAVNLFLNSCNFFNILKEKVKIKDENTSVKILINQAVNENKRLVFNNFLIFTILPAIVVVLFKFQNFINNYNSVEFFVAFFYLVAFLAIGAMVYLKTLFVLPCFIAIFKNKKVKSK